MGRAVVRDLIDLDYLRIENSLQKYEIAKLGERLIIGVEKEQNLTLRNVLLQKQAENYNRLYDAEKKKKPSWWKAFIRDVQVFALGAVAGILVFVVK